MKILTTRILFFYNLIGISNLIYLFINSLDKAIIYEDSFILLKPPEINLFNWFFTPHNGHIMLVSKVLSSVLFHLKFYPSSYFIPLGILIILIGLYFLWKLLNIISKKDSDTKIIFLICSYFWISPWHWENLIWEFQFPWFIVSALVIISTFIFLNKKDSTDFRLTEKVFLFISPLIAIMSTGAGICYVACLLINYLVRDKNKSFPLSGILLSSFIFIIVRLTTENNNNININIFTNIKYIVVMMLTIFKAPISANNSFSYIQWIIPILSSLLIQGYLIMNINWKKFINDISLSKKFALLNPIIFGIQFTIISSLTRSNYGIHQGAVSRYLTCLVLIPIGLIILFYYTTNINNDFSLYKKTFLKSKFSFLSKSNCFYLVIIICLILNTNSFFKTIYETDVSFKIRSQNFEIFKRACLKNSDPNKEFKLEENFYQLKSYLTTNIPPHPDAENLKTYKNYVNSELCDLTNTYFN